MNGAVILDTAYGLTCTALHLRFAPWVDAPDSFTTSDGDAVVATLPKSAGNLQAAPVPERLACAVLAIVLLP